MSDMYDPERGVTYGAIGCYNNEDINARCKVKNAPKKIWAILANNDINSQCALTLREELRQNNIRLLEPEDDFEEDFMGFTGASKLSVEDRIKFKLPFVNTTLAINEIANLETEIKGNYVKVREKSGCRKDRFSSLSYNIYVSNLLEKEYAEKNKKQDFTDILLNFRQPNITRNR